MIRFRIAHRSHTGYLLSSNSPLKRTSRRFGKHPNSDSGLKSASVSSVNATLFSVLNCLFTIARLSRHVMPMCATSSQSSDDTIHWTSTNTLSGEGGFICVDNKVERSREKWYSLARFTFYYSFSSSRCSSISMLRMITFNSASSSSSSVFDEVQPIGVNASAHE